MDGGVVRNGSRRKSEVGAFLGVLRELGGKERTDNF